jgi:hypothetical protein
MQTTNHIPQSPMIDLSRMCEKCGHQMSSVAHAKQCGAQVGIEESMLDRRKKAFAQGLADRIAGRPMCCFGDERDDVPELNDAYAFGYDPRDEMQLTRPEFREQVAVEVAELIKLTGSVIPDALPRNRCEFPNDEFSVEIPKVGTIKAESLEELGDNAWDAVHSADNGLGVGYGVSDVGSNWPVKKNGVLIGTLRYNGRFDAAVAS